MKSLFAGLVGFVSGLVMAAPRSTPSSNHEVLDAACKYRDSLRAVKEGLDQYEGDTMEEKHANWLKALGNADISHIKPIQPKSKAELDEWYKNYQFKL